MSAFYNEKRVKNLFSPQSAQPFKISRSKIELFTECPRCFYLDRRLGVGRPPGFPFNLNSAVDALLKKEFDAHRKDGTAHAFMRSCGVDAIPFAHPGLDDWRNPFKGIQHLHAPTNLLIYGGVDDLWLNRAGELHVVDYKATSKDGEVGIDAEWQGGYKRQVEIYQWLFRQNGFKVSRTAYFVYCNGLADKDAFDCRLEFKVKVIAYDGDDAWIEPAIYKIQACLSSAGIPPRSEDCDWCRYIDAVNGAENPERTSF